jgi:drug/metabolite transporter (DMT)-like permease
VKEEIRTHLILLAVVVIWSFAFLAIKRLLGQLDWLALNQARFTFSTLGFAPLLLAFRKRLPPVGAADLLKLALLGLVSVAGYHLSLNYGELFVPAGVTSLLVTTSPLFTLALAALFLGERVRLGQAAGFLLAFGGLFLCVAYGTPRDSGVDRWLGAALLLLAAFCWGAYTVSMKSLSRRLDPLQITGYSTIFGWAAMLPLLNGARLRQTAALSSVGWAWLAFLGLVCTVLGYFLFTYALARLEATRASAYLYLVPVLGLLWGRLFLGEEVNALVVAGAAMVITGLVLVEHRRVANLPPVLEVQGDA